MRDEIAKAVKAPRAELRGVPSLERFAPDVKDEPRPVVERGTIGPRRNRPRARESPVKAPPSRPEGF